MYRLLYLKEDIKGDPMSYQEFGTFPSLQAAARNRVVSGDLVFHGDDIVTNDSWLWEWEKKNPNCYAQRKIKKRTSVKGVRR